MERNDLSGTDESLELRLSDPSIRETVALMLEAGCQAPEIRAWFRVYNPNPDSLS
jgi:LEA14-like dessication related protein